MLKKSEINYQIDGKTFCGYSVYDESKTGKHPGVLIVHDWAGRGPTACEKAEQIAALGYVGFAVDLFGNATVFDTREERSQAIQPFIKDRHLIITHLQAALATLKNIPIVDANKIAAIGFCFGGLCVLDLARSGADIQGVVSFHGLLNKPENMPAATIRAKILALHGFIDPMVTPDAMMHFCQEMTEAKANWQLNCYGNTMHAFTRKDANDPDFGTVYNEQAAQRSWHDMRGFFQEIFGQIS
jgi:dienelactone hydrolase